VKGGFTSAADQVQGINARAGKLGECADDHCGAVGMAHECYVPLLRGRHRFPLTPALSPRRGRIIAALDVR